MTRLRGNCTIETLSTEYVDWVAQNGDGRDCRDIRFGQYLVNKYHNGEPFPALFYRESAAGAYEIALNELYYGDGTTAEVREHHQDAGSVRNGSEA